MNGSVVPNRLKSSVRQFWPQSSTTTTVLDEHLDAQCAIVAASDVHVWMCVVILDCHSTYQGHSTSRSKITVAST